MRLTVFPSKFFKSGGEAAPSLEVSTALHQTHTSDAHFATYSRPGEPNCPRVRKGSKPGFSVHCGAVCLDFDLPNHAADQDALDALRHDLKSRFLVDPAGSVEDPGLGVYPPPGPPNWTTPSFFHLTRAGARLIYVLSTPVEPQMAERIHVALVREWAFKGLAFDPNVWDWTRLFRLPKVTRDGVAYDPHIYKTGKTLAVEEIPHLPDPPGYEVIDVATGDQPSLMEAQQLMFTPRGNLTQWGKKAQKLLVGRMEGMIDECFEQSPPAWPEPRNVSMIRAVGSAVAGLHNQMHLKTTPQHLFALFLPRTHNTPFPPGRNLVQELWRMICYCWTHEASLTQHNEEEQEKIREAAPHDILKRLVVRAGRGAYYTLDHIDPNAGAYYNRVKVCRDTLYNQLMRSGLIGPDKLTDLQVHNNRGSRPMTPNEIINDHCMVVEPEIQKRPGYPRYGWVEEGTTAKTLVFGSYSRRTDLEPMFDPRVDQWLNLLFGERHEDGKRWVALALAFERGPICALSLTTDPGTGKNMFVQGLVEATEPQVKATSSVFGKYQYNLEDTPWIHVDEAWPSDVKDLGSKFRQLIGGGNMETNVKYGHLKSVASSPRVVITANNRECVSRLFSYTGLTQADVNAISQRLFHVDSGDQAALYLASNGGRDFTRGWIEGEDGSPSEHVLARHFLWLHKELGDSPSMGRFLMEYMTRPPELISWLSIKNSHVANMAEALCHIYARHPRDPFWVSTGEVKKVHDERQISRNQYTIYQIGNHLRLLSKEKDGERRRLIDLQKLRFYANEKGEPLIEPVLKEDA